MRIRPPSAVSIATSDSGGGAGIQADLLTFAAHGVYGATVLAAGTAQNTRAVTAIETFATGFLTKQIDAVFSDLRPRAVKIGMLFDASRIQAVARGLRRHRRGTSSWIPSWWRSRAPGSCSAPPPQAWSAIFCRSATS